jgi:sulfur-oxidizing protein SoxY
METPMTPAIKPDRTRRLIVKALFAGLGILPWLRRAGAADAALWLKDAFTQKTEADTIKALYGKTAEPS